ncbi:tail fiber protein [Paenibacillus illinoisensis]|uniref:Tail fiber protein n=1 Tax=Paenibacillus illinoisensis TaxID=59845 RepID=A0ABW8HSB5_9BACL
MPQETDRLKLPLPLGNENVTRESINGIFEKIDAGVASQADLDALREAVSKMDIPDASLTQKGKVQLSSKTDGTSETVAATEKAVRDARVAAETNAKNASLPRTGGVLTGVLTAPQIEMPNGTTIRTDSTRTTINAAANRFDVISTDGQKYLFSSRSGDFYMYDETGNLITTAKELKKSGVDAKNGIVGAINAKGGSASTSDTWGQLSAKVTAIQTGLSLLTGKVSAAGGRVDIPGYRPQVFILHSVESRNSQLWYNSLQNPSTAWIHSFSPLIAFRYPEMNNTKLLGARADVSFSNSYMFTGAEFKTLVFGDNFVEFTAKSSGDGYISQQTEYTILAIPV